IVFRFGDRYNSLLEGDPRFQRVFSRTGWWYQRKRKVGVNTQYLPHNTTTGLKQVESPDLRRRSPIKLLESVAH
ncbi:MAG: hypothetical protein AAF974_09365, partial [Cyanobacteria bacterium P01_E01_bin.34]